MKHLLIAGLSCLPLLSPSTFAQSNNDVRTGPLVMQEAYLKAFHPDQADELGMSIAIFGDTCVVGAPGDDSDARGANGNWVNNNSLNSGAAYVFVRTHDRWIPQGFLKAEVNQAGAEFGTSVAIYEDVIAVGAPKANGHGTVTVFRRNANIWTLEQTIASAKPDIGDDFGVAVSLGLNQLIVGAPGEDGRSSGIGGVQSDDSKVDSGAAFVFDRNVLGWWQAAYIKSFRSDEMDLFGKSVCLSQNTIVVGAPKEDGPSTGVDGDYKKNTVGNSGAAYVYVLNAGNWMPDAYLKASNTDPWDHFGRSVSIANDTIVVGAPLEDSNGKGYNGANNNLMSESGAAYVFQRNGTKWSSNAYLKPLNTTPDYRFGTSVTIFGNTIAIGAPYDSSSSYGTDGRKEQVLATTNRSGAVQVFARKAGLWVPSLYNKAMNAGGRDLFGSSIALHEGILAIGAPWEEGGAAGVNGDASDNSLPFAGAGYCVNLAPDWGLARYGTYYGANYADLYGLNLPIAGQKFILGLREFTGDGRARLLLSREPNWVVHHSGGVVHIDTDPQHLLIPGKFVWPEITDHAPGWDYAGRGTYNLNLPAASARFTFYAQAIKHDPSNPTGWALSNGLKIVVGG